jgi:hypothetical protein
LHPKNQFGVWKTWVHVFFLFWQLKVFVSLPSQVQKQPRLQEFLPKMRTKACLIPNLDHEKKNTRIRTQHVQNKNPIKFY